jgi:hypothetical protein
MEGKLVKDFNNYHLLIDGELYASTDNNVIGKQKLSLKSCETIKLGYDLDELAEEWCMKPENNWSNNNNEVGDNYGSYKEGFQKALEILGDKKFSISEVVELCKILMSNPFEKCGKTYQELIDNYIQSLQQTEWDVEIELICPHPSDTYVCGMKYGCDGDGCNHPEQIPYLDSDGCLILR